MSTAKQKWICNSIFLLGLDISVYSYHNKYKVLKKWLLKDNICFFVDFYIYIKWFPQLLKIFQAEYVVVYWSNMKEKLRPILCTEYFADSSFWWDNAEKQISFISYSTLKWRRNAFYESCQFTPTPAQSYFHFHYDVLPRHIVSVCLFHPLGLCFPQVRQSQGPCFKFIISCLKDEKPICLRGVWEVV